MRHIIFAGCLAVLLTASILAGEPRIELYDPDVDCAGALSPDPVTEIWLKWSGYPAYGPDCRIVGTVLRSEGGRQILKRVTSVSCPGLGADSCIPANHTQLRVPGNSTTGLYRVRLTAQYADSASCVSCSDRSVSNPCASLQGLPSLGFLCRELTYRYEGEDYKKWEFKTPVDPRIGRPRLLVWFNPLDCGLPECKEVVFLQLIQHTAEPDTGGVILESYEDLLIPSATVLDAELVTDKWSVDARAPDEDPFVNGNDQYPQDHAWLEHDFPWVQGSNVGFYSQGVFVDTVRVTYFSDPPLIRDPAGLAALQMPNIWAGIQARKWNFKLFAYCLDGEGRGQWLGQANWTWIMG